MQINDDKLSNFFSSTANRALISPEKKFIDTSLRKRMFAELLIIHEFNVKIDLMDIFFVCRSMS